VTLNAPRAIKGQFALSVDCLGVSEHGPGFVGALAISGVVPYQAK